MESARWEQIQAVFHAVADLPEPGRRIAVQTACGEDSELAADVLALLEEDAHRASLIDRDLGDLAHQSLDSRFAAHHLDELGPYHLLRLLGEGGMGIVYLAERRDLGSLVAIKVLRDAWLSPARRERFESEQRTLAQLNHANIALLFDAGILDDGTPWFVMEYVEGAPLTDYGRQHECSIHERLRLFGSVCEAVEYAHTQAIIHRDLKPSNILVKENGAVKLLDFGIAKQIETLEGGADQTRTALRFMTPAYAAPEQISGGRRILARTFILWESFSMNCWPDSSRSTSRRERLRMPKSLSCAAKRRSRRPSRLDISRFCGPAKPHGEI